MVSPYKGEVNLTTLIQNNVTNKQPFMPNFVLVIER